MLINKSFQERNSYNVVLIIFLISG